MLRLSTAIQLMKSKKHIAFTHIAERNFTSDRFDFTNEFSTFFEGIIHGLMLSRYYISEIARLNVNKSLSQDTIRRA